MKYTLHIFITLITFFSTKTFGQDITVNSPCNIANASGPYTYSGDYNGKPSYYRGVIDCSNYTDETTCNNGHEGQFFINWTGSRWEWYYSNENVCLWLVQLCVPKSIDEYTLIASNTSNTNTPPCTGWIPAPNLCVPEITSGCSCSIDDPVVKGDTTLCLGGTTQIKIDTSDIGLNYYLRSNADNTIIDGPYPGTNSQIIFNTGNMGSTMVYNLYASSILDSASCNFQLTDKVTINVPVLDLTVTNNSPELTANMTGATYQWLDCENDFAEISGETNRSFTATSTGNFAVQIQKEGCKDTSACEAIMITSISKNNFETQMKISPNPTNGNFVIFLGAQYTNIIATVKNSYGQEILKKTQSSTKELQLTIDGEPGIYLIEIIADDKKAMLKIIKK